MASVHTSKSKKGVIEKYPHKVLSLFYVILPQPISRLLFAANHKNTKLLTLSMTIGRTVLPT